MEMELVNLTPHAVSIVDDNGKLLKVYPASGYVARVEQTERQVGMVDDVPLVVAKNGFIVGIPEKKLGVLYIVSQIVFAASRRKDLLVPTRFVRDEFGNIIGCQAFITATTTEK